MKAVADRYVVKKESGSYWARVVDTKTAVQIARYSVFPRKRSTRDGWKEANTHAAQLNAAEEAKRQERRDAFDAKVRTHGYVDRVTGERIYDPDRLTASVDSVDGGQR